MEHKQFDAIVTDIDEDQGIVETIFAVMGNIDEGKDRIWPGSFTKTWAERAPQIRVMDQHNISSIMNVLGKPLGFKELGRNELPASLLEKFPDATGGAWAQVQFLMDTPEGKGAFSRIKADAINEWSFGYDALDFDYETVKAAGEDITVRNLRTIKMYELSPVVWGMNQATMTTGVKAETPEAAVEVDDRLFVSKAVNYDAITEQIRQAFYDQVQPQGQAMMAESPADVWIRELWDEFVIASSGDGLWKIAYTVGEDEAVTFALRTEWQQVEVQYVPVKSITAPAEQAAIETNIEQAGPDADEATPPTSTLSIEELEMTLTKLHLLEVGNGYISREV